MNRHDSQHEFAIIAVYDLAGGDGVFEEAHPPGKLTLLLSLNCSN
jgi:hypothetical protein